VCGSLAVDPCQHILMVAAMQADSFSERLARYRDQRVILFVANRPRILARAIEAHVHAIVVTGGLAVPEETRHAARAAGVTMISSPHDTATTVLLARGAVRVEQM